ncbi:MAG: hypothetical protein ACXWCY_10710 [Burkholderiales bacterium]
MDYNNGQTNEEPGTLAEAADAIQQSALAAGEFGIADVLFPATPPAPLNARLVRGWSFHDEAKPRGLARSAGLLPPTWERSEY